MTTHPNEYLNADELAAATVKIFDALGAKNDTSRTARLDGVGIVVRVENATSFSQGYHRKVRVTTKVGASREVRHFWRDGAALDAIVASVRARLEVEKDRLTRQLAQRQARDATKERFREINRLGGAGYFRFESETWNEPDLGKLQLHVRRATDGLTDEQKVEMLRELETTIARYLGPYEDGKVK